MTAAGKSNKIMKFRLPTFLYKSHKDGNKERTKETLTAEERVFNTLKCPCCWNFVGLYFEQCIRGHGVCSRCRKHIPNCPICRGQFVGRPVLLAGIVEHLIQLFSGLSSGDKAIDAYLKHQEQKPTIMQNIENNISNALLEKVDKTDVTDGQSPIYNAARASRSVEDFVRQQALMMRPSSHSQNSS